MIRVRTAGHIIDLPTDPDKTNCFGGRFGKVLTKYFLGYEVMIISSFKNLLPEKVGKPLAVCAYNNNNYDWTNGTKVIAIRILMPAL